MPGTEDDGIPKDIPVTPAENRPVVEVAAADDPTVPALAASVAGDAKAAGTIEADESSESADRKNFILALSDESLKDWLTINRYHARREITVADSLRRSLIDLLGSKILAPREEQKIAKRFFEKAFEYMHDIGNIESLNRVNGSFIKRWFNLIALYQKLYGTHDSDNNYENWLKKLVVEVEKYFMPTPGRSYSENVENMEELMEALDQLATMITIGNIEDLKAKAIAKIKEMILDDFKRLQESPGSFFPDRVEKLARAIEKYQITLPEDWTKEFEAKLASLQTLVAEIEEAVNTDEFDRIIKAKQTELEKILRSLENLQSFPLVQIAVPAGFEGLEGFKKHIESRILEAKRTNLLYLLENGCSAAEAEIGNRGHKDEKYTALREITLRISPLMVKAQEFRIKDTVAARIRKFVAEVIDKRIAIFQANIAHDLTNASDGEDIAALGRIRKELLSSTTMYDRP